MDVFNPKILDASIRDVVSGLSDNDKVDVLLYAMRNLHLTGRSRTVIENAVQSCLQIPTLSTENEVKARILRAKARQAAGSLISAQQDLEAALSAEPDNTEVTSLLRPRSTTPVKNPIKDTTRLGVQFSPELWREIAQFLPRRDLQSLLFVPHPVISRTASQLIFRKVDLHFSGWTHDDDGDPWSSHSPPRGKDQDAQRSADILTRLIVDPEFASLVRTLRIYSPRRDTDSSIAFQTGMLANAIPSLRNLRNIHITANSESIATILRLLQKSIPRLRGLSLSSTDGPGELGPLEFSHLVHFAYTTSGGNPTQVHNLIAQNASIRTLSLDNQFWTFPTDALSIRNLTHIDFFGHFPIDCTAIPAILSNGRQLESLSLSCLLDCSPSTHFRVHQSSLPFLRHFAFTVYSVNRRLNDRDLFPAIAEFLRHRTELRTLHLTVPEADQVQKAVGFDSAIWGVLPSLVNLRGLAITYPRDLSPGLAMWLIPRGVLALNLDCVSSLTRDPIPFLNQLRPGVPPTLRYIGLTDFPLRSISSIVEQGFPTIKLIRVGNNYWTVTRKHTIPRSKSDEVVELEMEQWPKRRIRYHTADWLDWLGCEDAQWRDHTEF